MAEMKIDTIMRGASQINPNRHADDGFKAALEACAAYMKKQKTHDMATWTKSQWQELIWIALSTGIHHMINTLENEVREARKEIDEIPY